MGGFYVNTLIFKTNQLVLYKKWEGDRSFAQKNCDLLKNFKGGVNSENNKSESIVKSIKKPYSGTMTKDSKKRLCNTINIFSQAVTDRWILNPYIFDKEKEKMGKRVKHKFTFLTLTIPDNEKRILSNWGYENLLEPFLFWLKKTVHCNTYIWKAELQNNVDFTGKEKQSKGQLHYHLILPNFIDRKLIQDKWNYILRINGLLDNYFLKYGSLDAPTTRIEKPYKGKNVGDYIIKEISKNCVSSTEIKELYNLKEIAQINSNKEEILKITKKIEVLLKKESESIGGKCWGCSENLQPKKEISIYDNYDIEKYKLLNEKSKQDETYKQLLKEFEKKHTNKIPNFFTLEFTETLEKSLVDLSFKYERENRWKITEYKNDFCFIWKMPNDYFKELLQIPTFENKEVTYYDLYNKFLIKRVGKINYRSYLKKAS